MKILFVYPSFSRHADHHPELRQWVPMNEYLGSPSLGMAALAAATPPDVEIALRDDRLAPADGPTDADIVALSFFTPAATRGLALARAFRDAGKFVVAGGIFPTMMPDEVQPAVDTVVVGEGEGVWPGIVEAVREGRRPPPRIVAPPLPADAVPRADLDLYLRAEQPGRFEPDDYPVQLARGCPLACRACALPTSMGGRTRALPIDHVRAQLDRLAAAGRRACLTEDTSWFPGPNGRGLLEQLVASYERDGAQMNISYIGISMPMILATPVRLFERLRAVGVGMFYLVGGFDPITTRAFTGRDPRALERAHAAIRRAHEVGIEPYTSFLIGNEDDDDGTADRMLDFAEAARIRKAEFAVFTPYPGTPSWHQLLAEDRILTRDWSRYNDANVVFQPKRMTVERLQRSYLDLWRGFYADRGGLAALPLAERTIQF